MVNSEVTEEQKTLIQTAATIAAADLRERQTRPEPEDVAEYALSVARALLKAACAS